MVETQNPLADLFVNEEEVMDELLKKLLIPYVGLSKSQDKIVPKSEFGNLPHASRVLLYLLARRAMVKLEVPGASPEAQAAKIAEESMISPKSCGETLSRLKRKKLIEKVSRGYSIPSHALLRIADELGVSRGKGDT